MSDEVDYARPRRPVSEPVADNTVNPELFEAWPIKCAYAVQEIFKTEADYIKDLNDIIQGYRVPLSNQLRSDNEGHQVISTLFCNIDEIFNLHKWLLDNLMTHHVDPHAFGQVFVKAMERFKMYSEYCNNYDAALARLQELQASSKDMDLFLRSCQQSLGHALPLSTQLIKPVQRIMRYHIMLKEVVKHFDGNHHGYHSLESAHQAMVKIGSHINEVKKRKENWERAKDLQSYTTGWTGKNMTNLSAYGELIIEDSCKMGNRGLERQAVLFEKLLLFVKKKDVKKYTYKAHIVTNELQIHDKFSESNPGMFKVSSLVHRHQSYVVDVGSHKKQQEWLDKMHTLVRAVIEQAKAGRLLPPSKPPPQHPVKRRRVEEETDSAPPEPEFNKILRHKDSSAESAHSRGSRVSTKRRSRGDVRELFPGDNAAKLQSYSITPQTSQTSTSSAQMQTIPESQELEGSSRQDAPHTNITVDSPPSGQAVQHTEPLSDQPEQKQGGKRMTTSTSMDSLLSLTDLEFGMEEQAVEKEETDGAPPPRKLSRPEDSGKPKLARRAAIKVKRNSVRSLSASNSTSSLLRARAREMREASRSPERSGLSGEDDASTEEPDSLLPFILDKMQSAPAGSDLNSSFSIADSSFSSVSDVKEPSPSSPTSITPVPPPPSEQVQDSGVVCTDRMEEEMEAEGDRPLLGKDYPEGQEPSVSLSKLSPFKRPRSYSHEQESMAAASSNFQSLSDQSVGVEIVIEGDDLELGESCGQAKLRGRASMPVVESEEESRDSGSAQWEHSGTGSDIFNEQNSGLSGDSVGAVGGLQGAEMGEDFMIVEDSSDEEEDSVEDFEVTAEELEATLLEAAEVGAATLPQEGSTYSPANERDQVVPGEEPTQKPWVVDGNTSAEGADFTEFFSSLNDSATSGQSPDSEKPSGEVASSSVFHFEASPSHSREAEIYGTLPHRKKSRPGHSAPQKTGNNVLKSAHMTLQDPGRSSARRAEGFSRLLEFTRQQQEEMETCQLSTFEVTQSLPVCSGGAVLQDIAEDLPQSLEFSAGSEELCLLANAPTDKHEEQYPEVEQMDQVLKALEKEEVSLNRPEVSTEVDNNKSVGFQSHTEEDAEIMSSEAPATCETAVTDHVVPAVADTVKIVCGDADMFNHEPAMTECPDKPKDLPVSNLTDNASEFDSDLTTERLDNDRVLNSENVSFEGPELPVSNSMIDANALDPEPTKAGSQDYDEVMSDEHSPSKDAKFPVSDVVALESSTPNNLPLDSVNKDEDAVPSKGEFSGIDKALDQDTQISKTVAETSSGWGFRSLSGLLPSKAGLVAIGVGVTAVIVFFAVGSYFK